MVITEFQKEKRWLIIAYTIQDLDRKKHPLETEIDLTEEENGVVHIDFTIEPTSNNRRFMKRITEDWLIFGVQDTKYGHFVVTSLDKESAGEYPSLKIRAEASFLHKLKSTTFDGLYTGSRTAVEFFRILSEQSDINFTVMDFKEAFGWEKFGEGVHNLTEFNRALKNYGYVYEPISEHEISMKDTIGRDVQFVIKNAMNADGMKLSIDRSEVYTQADGYGDFEEDEDFYTAAKVFDRYTSPLASVIGIKRAETYTNQNIKHKDTMRQYLKDRVNNSVKFNVTTNFYRIKKYPFAVPQLGDRIRVQDESIDLNNIAKLIKLVTRYDPYGEVYDYELTFGNLELGQRNRKTISTVSRMLMDLISGREPLKGSALDSSTRSMIADFKDAQTELIIGDYKDGIKGIFLVERDDPNRAVGLTSRGIVLTINGFAGGIDENLAISPEAINASLVRAGTLFLEEFLGIEGKDGWLTMTGDELLMKSLSDESKYFRARAGEVTIAGMLEVLRDDGGAPSIIAGRNTLGERLQGMNPAFMSPAIDVFGQRYRNDTDEMHTVDAYYYDQYFRDIQINFAFRNNSETESITIEYGVSGFGSDIDMRETDTVTVPPQTTEYPQLDFHVGVPQKNQRQFYIQFRRITTSNSALMSIARVKNLDMNKYNHL